LIPTPIRHVLSTIQASGTRALVIGGQACVFYGAAQFSKDIDFLILPEEENFRRFQQAMDELNAKRFAFPPLPPESLARGHAVHFRCDSLGFDGLRIDVMSRLRAIEDFETLWERRTIFTDEEGSQFHLLSPTDLVQSKKTQRSKDWPIIEALVTFHYAEMFATPTDDRIRFWLLEARSPETLVDICARFPEEAAELLKNRPLLALAIESNLLRLREELDAEKRREQEKDRLYWEPLKREMEEFRRAERAATQGCS
jgi:hypothetical protein